MYYTLFRQSFPSNFKNNPCCVFYFLVAYFTVACFVHMFAKHRPNLFFRLPQILASYLFSFVSYKANAKNRPCFPPYPEIGAYPNFHVIILKHRPDLFFPLPQIPASYLLLFGRYKATGRKSTPTTMFSKAYRSRSKGVFDIGQKISMCRKDSSFK